MYGIQRYIPVSLPRLAPAYLILTRKWLINCLLMMFLSAVFTTVQAQPAEVWKNLNAKQEKALKQKQKKAGQLKSWAKQAREWGMDNTYTHELSLGLNLHTNGVGGHLRYATNKKSTHQDIWLLQVRSVQHEKEIKQQRKGTTFRELGPFRPYHFGKINNILNLQLGYGKEQILLPSIINENISIYGSLVGGVSLIVQKPVYLNLIYTDSAGASFVQSERYSTGNESLFLNNSRILGADKWSKGLAEATIVPGLFLEPALVFVPAKNKAFIQKVYIGGNIAWHLKATEIMALHRSLPVQASFFVGIGFGKRWK